MNMISPNQNKDVALIVGPTASGKSALALETAAHERDMLPILVGGTGLYVRTLLDGIAPIPEIDPEIRHEIRGLETLEAYEALQRLDPVSAERLNPADRTRIQRALEVVRSTGRPLDHWHRHKKGGIASRIKLHPLVLLPSRDWLYQRCNLRLDAMIETGAKDEVELLLSRKLPPNQPVMRAIGVAEIAAWLAGDITRDVAVERAQTATRRYAKRQYTWFRNQCPSGWPRANESLYDDFDSIFGTILRGQALT